MSWDWKAKDKESGIGVYQHAQHHISTALVQKKVLYYTVVKKLKALIILSPLWSNPTAKPSPLYIASHSIKITEDSHQLGLQLTIID